MSSRTVTSPAGELVEIVPDSDWLALVGAENDKGMRQWGESLKPYVFCALWNQGTFTNKSGRASIDVFEWIHTNFPAHKMPKGTHGVMSLWRNPTNAPAVETKINGKRTFSIRLIALPETWYSKVLKMKPRGNGVAPEAPVAPQAAPVVDPALEATIDRQTAAIAQQGRPTADESEWTDEDFQALQLDAPTFFEQPPPLEAHVSNQVAMSLLLAVVEIINNGTVGNLTASKRLSDDLQQVQEVLAKRLEENGRLRKQLREAATTIVELRQERDQIRTRLLMTERNLTEVLRGDTAQVVNAEVRKRVDAVMRQTPTMKGT
jgi:hypothetical protein